MRFGVWVLLLYNFLSATYNLICGTNPHEEDYRLTVDWHSCGFFYSKTKIRRFDYVIKQTIKYRVAAYARTHF